MSTSNIPRPDWGLPAEGAGLGGRETAGDAPAAPTPALLEALQTANPGPAAKPAAAPALAQAENDDDDPVIADLRKTLQSGHWTPEEVRQHYAHYRLSDEEWAQALQSAPRRTTLASIERELESSFDNDLTAGARTEVVRWMARDAAAWRPAEESLHPGDRRHGARLQRPD